MCRVGDLGVRAWSCAGCATSARAGAIVGTCYVRSGYPERVAHHVGLAV